jgi:uncharacterized repeat protein (TIGR01451 family)
MRVLRLLAAMKALRGSVVVLSLLALAATVGAVPASATNPTETVTVSQAPDPVSVGQTVAYTTVFKSTRDLNNMGVRDIPPNGLTFVSATPSSGTCAKKPSAVTCKIGTIHAGSTVTVVFVFRVPQTPGTLTNSVRWTGTTAGYHPSGIKVTRKTVTTVVPRTPNLIATYVLPAGDTVATGNTVSNDVPQATSADIPETPLGTPVTINQVAASGPADACGPAANCFGKISEISVGSTFTQNGPMTFVITVDSSQIPYGSSLPMYHDGVLVPNCTGAPGQASPDPCVASRTFVPSTQARTHAPCDVVFTIYSSTNGRWRP